MSRRQQFLASLRELIHQSLEGRHGPNRRKTPNIRGIETLEDRRVLSVFYDFEVVGKAGQNLSNRQTIADIFVETSVDELGNVAFPAVLTNETQALIVKQIGATRDRVTDNLPGTDRGFHSPQLNNFYGLSAIETDQGVGQAVRVWSALQTRPPQEIVAAGDAGPGVTFEDIVTASVSDDGDVAFVNLEGNSTDLYVTDSSAAAGIEHISDLPENSGAMIASGKRLVYHYGTGTTGEIRVEVPDTRSGGYTRTALASTTFSTDGNTFIRVGTKPGISDDGTVIAFIGDRGFGPGLFISMAVGNAFSAPTMVAGEPNGPGTTHPRAGWNNAGDMVDLIDFDFFSRVGIARLGEGSTADVSPSETLVDRFAITLLATPSSKSFDNPQLPGIPFLFSEQQGIWTLPVNIERQLNAPGTVVHPQSPIPVVQVGDTLDGSTIQTLTLHDPVAAYFDPTNPIPNRVRGDHFVTFHAMTGAGGKVVLAKHLDTDADGLLDHWETRGIDIDGDKRVDLNLAAMGANPRRKDLFVELDKMTSFRSCRFASSMWTLS